MRNKIRLLKNLVVLLVVGGMGLLVYKKFTAKTEDGFVLSDSPLHIESIQKIAELATISFQDELVVDTFEVYKNETEKIAGNFYKMNDLDGLKDVLSASQLKRRLTLIIKGEAKIGFNLTENNYRIEQNQDSIWFHFPKAEVLDINLNPLETEVFQESGTWLVSSRKDLMRKAKTKIEKDIKKAKLIQKAEQGLSEVLRMILRDERTTLIYYE